MIHHYQALIQKIKISCIRILVCLHNNYVINVYHNIETRDDSNSTISTGDLSATSSDSASSYDNVPSSVSPK